MIKSLPNFFTLSNVFVGALGCYVVFQHPEDAFYFVLLGAFFDFLDGFFARMLKATSAIGKQLDSLADLVTFGVLPSLAVALSADKEGLFIFPLLIVPFSAFRLARFNIASADHPVFYGLPTPANALMMAALLLFTSLFQNPIFLVIISLLSCFLLVSKIKLLAFKFSSAGSWSRYKWHVVYALLVILGFSIFKETFFAFMIPMYVFLSLIAHYIFKDIS